MEHGLAVTLRAVHQRDAVLRRDQDTGVGLGRGFVRLVEDMKVSRAAQLVLVLVPE